ncbi:MAG: phenylalanine--tRNA ligase subunit alpha, partial [Desulfobacterales bacterium]|nr:phenylalanine--tRNA ligase subunit alpha [Desulfobacterales bacterium]
MEKSIEEIKADALEALAGAGDEERIQALSVQYLGRKGLVTGFLRNISSLPPARRAGAGKMANQVKKELNAAFKDAVEELKRAASEAEEGIDVTLPGRETARGSLHPITRITAEICDIFARIGFNVVEGPEVEKDWYNFEALNIPKNHPARDMQDTFYVSDDIVLRTHTSPVQIRT